MTMSVKNPMGRPANRAFSPSADAERAMTNLIAQICRAYEQASDGVKDVVQTMTSILNDPQATQEELWAAADTLHEALFPTKWGNTLGADIQDMAALDSEGKPFDDAEIAHKEEAFAANVRKLMKEKRVTQSDLARAIGVGQSAIAMMLSRECRPQKATVKKIAEALGVPSTKLWPE